ncbi:MAG TPA: hypothetical protein VM492_17240 [Sumerlaeia bacterium]|nr:hypothetical protein [Sumerlaeia bacterium]
MDREIEVEVFRAGDYGPRGAYSEEDVENLAADYKPEIHEAPVTVDHKQDGPALGWVRGLRRVGTLLIARLGGLAPEFLEKIKSGAFKKRSIELYRALQATGRPYLRALTFLGAGAPVVKGLGDPVFGEEDGTVHIAFEEAAAPREESAEGTPADEIEAEANAESTAQMGEPREDWHSEPSQAPEPPRTFAEIDPETARFCEEMRQAGRLLPTWEEKGVAAFMSALDDRAPVRFNPSPGAPPRTARAWFREFIESLAPIVPMGEAAPATGCGESCDLGPLPQKGRAVHVDDDSLALHREVCRFRQVHPGVCYSEALGAVVRGA